MKIGIALSGGGLKGISHLGVIKALYEMGIQFDCISGCSAGAIVGAFIANGYSPNETLEIIKEIKIQNLLKPSKLRGGMLKLNILQDKLLKYLPEDQFESLEIPLTVNATDIINGKLIEFNSGKLSIPILASCSVPGLFEPLVYHDKLLIDGGVLCNLPIEPLIESKCDFIFASHCNPLRPLQSNSPNIRALIARSLFMSIHKTSTEKAKICDFFIEPQELVTVKRYSFSKIDTIFKMGYEATKVLEDKILKNMAQKS